MRDWIYLVTLLMVTTIVLIMISTLYGCSTFEAIKESAKVVKIISLTDKKTKKEKNDEIKVTELKPLEYEQEQEKANIIACIKVQSECNREW